MDRIFKRPMFRKGGISNEGIMDGLKPPRQKMEMGGVPDAVGGLPKAISKKPGFFQGILEALNPSPETIVRRRREVQQKPFLFEGIFDPAKETLQFKTPEEQEAFYEKYPDLKLPKTEVKPEEEPLVTPEIEPKPEIKKESDLETVYSDLLPLFQKELGMDADETKRQKYLQLAQFGLGLLAQPGGDLTGAVGRAAQKPLADLQRLQEIERQERALPRRLALEAALKRTEDTDVEKKINALARISKLPKEEVAKSFVTTTADTASQAATLKLLREGAQTRIGLGPAAALNYAQKISQLIDVDPSLAGAFDKLVPEKPQEGEYYVTNKGDLTRYKDGKFLKPADKGFKD